MIGRLLVSQFSSSFSTREMFLVEQVLEEPLCEALRLYMCVPEKAADARDSADMEWHWQCT